MSEYTKEDIFLAGQKIVSTRNKVIGLSLSWHEARRTGKDKQGLPFGNVCSLLEQAVEELISAQATWNKVQDQLAGRSLDEGG